jgi:hypothetical protein
VVHRLTALFGRFDGDRKKLADMRLPGEIGKPRRAERGLKFALVFL